jgi:hypothetical protein
MALRPGSSRLIACAKVFERLERIPVARYQPAGAVLDVSDRSKTI